MPTSALMCYLSTLNRLLAVPGSNARRLTLQCWTCIANWYEDAGGSVCHDLFDPEQLWVVQGEHLGVVPGRLLSLEN